jgi:hypothetical protein
MDGVSIAWILRARRRAQMNATRPGATTEYSRGSGGSGTVQTHAPRAEARGRAPFSSAAGAAILAGALLGALLLLVAEFTTLFEIRTAPSASAMRIVLGPEALRSVATGSHHSYALVPIALLVVVLAYAIASAGSRPALLAIGVMGVIALLIALLGDLPDAHTSGLVGTAATHYVAASSTPSAGLYMETLGGALLLVTCVCGFLLIGRPPALRQRRTSPQGA